MKDVKKVVLLGWSSSAERVGWDLRVGQRRHLPPPLFLWWSRTRKAGDTI